VKKLQQMVASDPGRAFDLTQVQARVAMAQSTLVERQAALRASEAAYREIVGRVPGALSLPQVPVVPELRSLDQALTVGQAEHPTVKAAGARTKVREAARGEAQGSLVPRLDAMARYVRGMDRQSLPGQNDEVYAGLRATYAFPLGMATVAQARGAEMLLESQTHKLEAARRDVREAVRVAWAQREGLEATLPLATEHWKRVGKVLEGFKTQYSLGRRSMLDLLIVQDEVYSAESRKIQLTYDRVLADFAVMAQAGTLVAHYAPADDTPAPATPPLRIERADGPAAEQVSQH
jgi:adhesin transport system outer membrane protein